MDHDLPGSEDREDILFCLQRTDREDLRGAAGGSGTADGIVPDMLSAAAGSFAGDRVLDIEDLMHAACSGGY